MLVLDKPLDIDDDASGMDAFRLSGRITGDFEAMMDLGLPKRRGRTRRLQVVLYCIVSFHIHVANGDGVRSCVILQS